MLGTRNPPRRRPGSSFNPNRWAPAFAGEGGAEKPLLPGAPA